MHVIKIVYWQDEDMWLGYLQDYPDYWTQGETLDDLKTHLKDLYEDMASGSIPGIRKVGELIAKRSSGLHIRHYFKRCAGQTKRKHAAYTNLAFDPDPPTVRLDN